MRRTSLGLIVVTISTTVLAGVFITSAAVGALGGKSHTDPVAGLSDAQKQQLVDRAHVQELGWARAFLASGKDPRLLAPVVVESWAAPVTGFAEATARADLVVHGRMERTEFVLSADGALPAARSIVRIIGYAKGKR